MSVTWLIQSDVFDEDYLEPMCEAVESHNHTSQIFRYIPFGGGLDSEFKLPAPGACVIVYGSLNAVKYARRQPWVPGVWCNFDQLRCSAYLARWGRFSVHREYMLVPLGDLRRLAPFLYEEFSVGDTLFIRPDDNAKSFDGSVVAWGAMDSWLTSLEPLCLRSDLLCLISRPAEILAEYRFVIALRKVVTGSMYRKDGAFELSAAWPTEASQKAHEIANSTEYNPQLMYVMDIAETPRGYQLLEIGSVNCAGLYKCDLDAVVQRASELAVAEHADVT